MQQFYEYKDISIKIQHIQGINILIYSLTRINLKLLFKAVIEYLAVRRRVLEKLVVSQLVKKLPTSYVTLTYSHDHLLCGGGRSQLVQWLGTHLTGRVLVLISESRNCFSYFPHCLSVGLTLGFLFDICISEAGFLEVQLPGLEADYSP